MTIKSSILDAGCWRNAVLLGVDRANGLRTWIRDRYSLFELFGTDTTDGAVSDNAVYREADENTLTFVVPGTVAGSQALVNTCAEFPPSPLFPMREYTPDYISRSAAWSARAYAWDQGPRRYVSAPGRLELRATSGGPDLTLASPTLSLSGWQVREHRLAFTNNETQYEVWTGGVHVADAMPWHGYFARLGAAAVSSGLAYDVSPAARHAVAYVEDGTVRVGVAPNSNLDALTFVDSGLNAESIALRWASAGNGELRLYIAEGGNVTRRVSLNEGESWSVATTIGSGTQVAAVAGQGGTEFVYRVDGSAIKGKRFDARGNLLESEFTAVASGVDDTQIDAAGFFDRQGRFRVAIYYSAGGVVTRVESPDGITFS